MNSFKNPYLSRAERTCFVSGLLLLSAHFVTGQTNSTSGIGASAKNDLPKLTYDVASIHESHWDSGQRVRVGSDSPLHEAKYEGMNIPLAELVQQAYGLRRDQVVSDERWHRMTTFVVQARSDVSATDALKKLSDHDALRIKQEMLQDLLASRFHLKVHTEVKELPAYTLTVAKKGLKLRASKPAHTGDATADIEKNKPDYFGRCDQHGCEVIRTNCKFSDIVSFLQDYLGASIIDKTAVSGSYDFALKFNGIETGDRPDNGTTDWPPLTTALQDTLGLQLERGRGPVEVTVIDHAEMPSEN